ncbi:MAG TPA: fumarate hydratase [Thermodesulfobacteriaceae bacterium]|nr:fumarate hydratase [Thermodesulfobacteriaceae bacterium]
MHIDAPSISETVSLLVQAANRFLPRDVIDAIAKAGNTETSRSGRMVLEIILENARVATATGLPICQDTGIDAVFIRLGQDLRIGGDLLQAVNSGIALGTEKGFLRSSVCDPLTRRNTGDNTPSVVHVEPVPGNILDISLLPKGCGSENMSCLTMLPPSAGTDGIVNTVINQVKQAGPNPCPPGIIGVGIGGTMEQAALIAKKALLRPLGEKNPRPDARDLERRITGGLNALKIGPLGLGGEVTTLGVAVELYPCHIASLPVAVNVQCHAARRSRAVWENGEWRFSQDQDTTGSFSSCSTSAPAEGPSFPGQAAMVNLPLSGDTIAGLRAGDMILLNGWLYTGRDQTHRRLVEMMDRGEELPVDISGELIYYVGPSPAPPGRPVGSAGPTTSYRMDAYTPRMLALGMKAAMGKGRRSPVVRKAFQNHGAVYLAALGGAGAFLAGCIEECELTAFPELGPEALYRMKVRNFPAVVIFDINGNNHYSDVLDR